MKFLILLSFRHIVPLWREDYLFMVKCRIEVEDFSGKTERAVRQDFHAKILLMTLCAIFAHPIEEKVREEFKRDERRKHDQQINRTQAISATREMLIPIFLKNGFHKAIEFFDDIVYQTREIVRPNRKVERKMKTKKPFRMNDKQL